MTRYREAVKEVEEEGNREYAGVIDSQIRRLYAGKKSRYEQYMLEAEM
jgi:hypothetical protein